jgi:ribosome biogenesis GTPase
MTLVDLGLDHGWASEAVERCGPGSSIARVTAVDRGRYLIRGEGDEVSAELMGKVLHLAQSAVDLPCVGDWLCVRYRNGGAQASIHDVLPRRSVLRRKAAGRDVEFQMIAANIDVAFIVQSCHFDFKVQRLERYLVIARDGHVEPVVLLTKTDLVTTCALEQLVGRIRTRGVNAQIVRLSNVTGSGVEQVRELIVPGRTYCLLGSSGVGKTTLINALIGGGVLETGTVSHTGEGRHTTTRRQLIVLGHGGLLIDMPGMRDLGVLGAHEGIGEPFADINALAQGCRYTDCRHASEPGCEVRAAIERHELSEEHLRNYLKLQKEGDFNELSYVDRRKKRIGHSAGFSTPTRNGRMGGTRNRQGPDGSTSPNDLTAAGRSFACRGRFRGGTSGRCEVTWNCGHSPTRTASHWRCYGSLSDSSRCMTMSVRSLAARAANVSPCSPTQQVAKDQPIVQQTRVLDGALRGIRSAGQPD